MIIHVTETAQSDSHFSTVNFRTPAVDRIIGTLGESLDHSTQITWDDDEEEAVETEAETSNSIRREDEDMSSASDGQSSA